MTTTKILLTAIAIGLWANLGLSIFRPTPAVAYGDNCANAVSLMDGVSRDVDRVLGTVDGMRREIDGMRSSLTSIESGSCSNYKICQ
jgi:hypothetical protein